MDPFTILKSDLVTRSIISSISFTEMSSLSALFLSKPNGPGHWLGQLERRSRSLCPELPVVAFKLFSFVNKMERNQSWDQKYLSSICKGVTGVVGDVWVAIEPGFTGVSRWRNLWSRILRLYEAMSRPNQKLKKSSL